MKFQQKKGNDKKPDKEIEVNNVIKEKINLEKLESIEQEINKIMNDLKERNKDNSQEKNMFSDICDIQTKILTEVTKNNENKNDVKNYENEEEEEEEDDQ